MKNYGHYCFDYLNFYERKSAYLFLNRICKKDKNVLIYPSGSIYTSITERLSKSVSKLSMIHNIEVIAWKFIFDDKAKIEYDRNIGKYILKRIYADRLVIRVEKVKFSNKRFSKFRGFSYGTLLILFRLLKIFVINIWQDISFVYLKYFLIYLKIEVVLFHYSLSL